MHHSSANEKRHNRLVGESLASRHSICGPDGVRAKKTETRELFMGKVLLPLFLVALKPNSGAKDVEPLVN